MGRNQHFPPFFSFLLAILNSAYFLFSLFCHSLPCLSWWYNMALHGHSSSLLFILCVHWPLCLALSACNCCLLHSLPVSLINFSHTHLFCCLAARESCSGVVLQYNRRKYIQLCRKLCAGIALFLCMDTHNSVLCIKSLYLKTQHIVNFPIKKVYF